MHTNLYITKDHLKKKAIIYVRQSSMQQVLTHKESLNLQYNLKNKAISFGWDENQIEIIDLDLGISGKSADTREGFKYIMAEVAVGSTGIIFAYDATRLSRNCSDWYPLLDICAFKKCLIGDIDSIYDPSTMNGRLLLGIKGQLAEIELSTIKNRLIAGLSNKAERGDLELKLPAGYVRNNSKVEKDPNIEVQNIINIIFQTFFSVKSAAMTFKFFKNNNLFIPRYNELNQLFWKNPTYSDILGFLKNPAYAGTYVYGKTESVPCNYNVKKIKSKIRPQSEWRYVIKNKYPGYITWEKYELITKTLADNYADYKNNNSRGTPKHGTALLQGIIYCGKCGYKMVVEYNKGKTYICNHLARVYRSKLCQTIIATPIDSLVTDYFFRAISQIELNSYENILSTAEEEKKRIEGVIDKKLKRLRYEAQLAGNRYNQVDPHNRLVADELEKRWEYALVMLKEAEDGHSENTIDLNPIPEQLKHTFLDLGKRLPDLWDTGILSNLHKKLFLRCLIDKVVVNRNMPDKVQIRIVWKGGQLSEIISPLKVAAYSKLSNYGEMKTLISEAYTNGKKDAEIAGLLNQMGFTSPDLTEITDKVVQAIRLKLNLSRQRGGKKTASMDGYLSIRQLSTIFNIDRHWISDRIYSGKIKISKHSESGTYFFPDTEATRLKFSQFIDGKVNSLNFNEGYKDE